MKGEENCMARKVMFNVIQSEKGGFSLKRDGEEDQNDLKSKPVREERSHQYLNLSYDQKKR